MNLKGRNFLTLLDYTPEEIRYLLDLAHNLKMEKHKNIPHRCLEGKNIVLLFECLNLNLSILDAVCNILYRWLVVESVT